jgi:AP2 domain
LIPLKSAGEPDGAWQAKITLPTGHKVHKSFSIRKFGHAEAFDLAVKARTELLELVDDLAYLMHPVAKRMAAKSGIK